ncbi:MAG: hypothetical protein KAQ68_01040, partial [Clostridiales bacterium]|nr:hypothetical protein [Clostridiales bacterium]
MTDQKRKEHLKKWIDDYGKLVLATALRIADTPQDAEDVFQNTFTKAYCRTLPFRSEEHTKAWLIRVAVNDCLSKLRSSWKTKVVLGDLPDALSSTISNDSEIIPLLQNLPSIYKEAVYLHYWA